MSVSEESPILIPSEDEEDEDGDDVQYIKEEKALPITIDENEDQDDVIFVSTCPAPTPALPPSWDESLGITDNMDLDTFPLPLSSSTPSCSNHLTHIPGGSGLGTPFSPMTDMVDGSLLSSVGVGSSDLSSISDANSDLTSLNDSKMSVNSLSTDLSLGSGNDLTVSVSSTTTNLTPIASIGPDRTISGIQLQNILSPATSNASVPINLPSLSGESNVNSTSISDSSLSLSTLNGVCTSPARQVMASKPSMSQPLYSLPSSSAFQPASGPLDLSPPDKCQQLKPRRKKKREQSLSSAVSDADDSNSESSGDDEQGDGSIGAEMSGGECKVKANRTALKARGTSPLCPISQNMSSFLNGSQTLTPGHSGSHLVSACVCSSQVTMSTSLWPRVNSSPASANTISTSVNNSDLLQGASAACGPASSAKNIPPATTTSFCHSEMTRWLDSALSTNSTAGSSTTDTSIAQCLSGASRDVQSAINMVLNDASKTRKSSQSHSSGILPIQSVGATPPLLSFSSNDLMQTSSITSSHTSSIAPAQTSTFTDTLASSVTNVISSSSCPRQHSDASSVSQVQQSGMLLTPTSSGSSSASQSQSGLQLDQQIEAQLAQVIQQQQKQKQFQASSSKGTDTTSDSDFFDKLFGQSEQANGSKGINTTSNYDFFDKLLGDCDSILSNTLVPSKGSVSSSSAAYTVCSSSTSVVDASSVAPKPSPSAFVPQSSLCTASDKCVKRSNHSSLSTLDNSSLPPRKRVRPSLMNSLSYTPGSTSAFTVPPALLPNQPLPSSTQDLTQTLKPNLLVRSSSYPATDPSHQDASLLPCNKQNLKQLSGGNAHVTQPTNGNHYVAVASTSGAGQDSAVISAVGTQSMMECKKCRKKEGENCSGSEGEECKLSRCPQGHAACGGCLMVQARRVLTGKQKESLKCIVITCSSFYPIKELKNSLPSLIVEILQERFDHDLVEYIDNMISDKGIDNSDDTDNVVKNDQSSAAKKTKSLTLKSCQARRIYHCIYSNSDDEDDNNNACIENDSEDDMTTMRSLKSDYEGLSDSDDFPNQRGSSNSTAEQQNDFPEHWTRMDNSKNLVEVVAVPLEPDSDEYINVALRFHEHMLFPNADITKIVRIQNPYLWKSYSLKKEQMIQENGGMIVNEYQLFHGTKASTIDAICRRGFDWRFCGKHGTAYGHGCYFAGDSLYSNTYTDRGSTPTNGSLFLKSIMQVSSSHKTDSSYSSASALLAPPPPALHPGLSVLQRAASTVAGSSSGQSVSKSGLPGKKTLLKNGHQNQSALLAHLLKKKAASVKRMLLLGTTTHVGGQTKPLASGPLASQAQSSVHHALTSLSRPQHAHPQASSQPQGQSMYQYKKYSLLAGSERHHPFTSLPSQSPQQGHHPTSGGQSLHPSSLHAPSGSTQGPGHKSHSGFAAVGNSSYAGQPGKKYIAGASSFSSVSPLSGKVSAVMVRSSSAQPVTPQAGTGLIMPVGSYPASLSVATTAVTLSGAGAQPLALLTTNPGSSVQGSSYLVLAPLTAPTQAPLPPPLGTLQPPPLLGQPGSLPNTLPSKPAPWSSVGMGTSTTGQALDLRKQSSGPRYMFLARVLTGMATGGASDFRRPPPLDPQDPLGRCYDSCVDNIYTPRIWVIFDSTQAYPEYAIEYHVNGDLFR